MKGLRTEMLLLFFAQVRLLLEPFFGLLAGVKGARYTEGISLKYRTLGIDRSSFHASSLSPCNLATEIVQRYRIG